MSQLPYSRGEAAEIQIHETAFLEHSAGGELQEAGDQDITPVGYIQGFLYPTDILLQNCNVKDSAMGFHPLNLWGNIC